MKNYNWIVALVLALSFSFTACDEDTTIIDTPQVVQLDQEEITGLQYMVEEEKLARDVYAYFYQKYNLQMFNNISESEQTHVNSIVTLLDKYDIENPSLPEAGKFSNVKLQGLYNDLIAAGELSQLAALNVGATIEDVDIFDLDDFTSKVIQEDIIDVYNKLNCGSRNHMRAFTRQIVQNNSTYNPQFITLEDYTQIINNDNEKCGQQ